MDFCTLAALLTCFSLDGIYLDSGISYRNAEVAYFDRRDYFRSEANGVQEEGWRTVASTQSRNPYGFLSLGYELRFQSVTVSLEAFHDSSMATSKDRGVEGISLRGKWYPFR